MFDKSHYVPILKTKEGEFWALRKLAEESRKRVTPLLEIDKIPRPPKPKPPVPGKKTRSKGAATVDTHLAKKCAKIADAWGILSPFFLDTVWLAGADGNPEIVSSIFEATRSEGLISIPVATTAQSGDTLTAIRGIIDFDGHGVLLRLKPDDLSRPHVISAVLTALDVEPDSTHLMLDYGAREMNLPSHVPLIPRLMEWKSFSAASGMFPSTLAGLAEGRWNNVPRKDWMSWKAGITSKAFKRSPNYSDYTVRAPGAPAEGGSPPVVMKYAAESKWIVRIDGSHMGGDSPNMFDICKSLVGRDEFCGEGFSAGDSAIRKIADGELGTGGPTQWVQYAVNHHLEYVIREDLPST